MSIVVTTPLLSTVSHSVAVLLVVSTHPNQTVGHSVTLSLVVTTHPNEAAEPVTPVVILHHS